MTHSPDYTFLFDTHYPKLYAYVRSRVADRETAEDITAAAFERAFKHTYDPDKASFATWLFHIARNLVINHYAAAARQPVHFELEEVAEVEIDDLTPEQQLLRREQQRRLLEAISILSERDQEIIQLRFFGRLTNRKIAEVMDIKEKTVSVIILRALEKMKTHLDQQQLS